MEDHIPKNIAKMFLIVDKSVEKYEIKRDIQKTVLLES
jgi:hypothetical protein